MSGLQQHGAALLSPSKHAAFRVDATLARPLQNCSAEDAAAGLCALKSAKASSCKAGDASRHRNQET
jgi:hypothetical protein